MSCCSNGYCNFEFPYGPPLTDQPVSGLNAKYLFLPYGTLLEEGELVRLWTEAGKTREAFIEHKIPLHFSSNGPIARESFSSSVFLPWQLIALDSGYEESTILDWQNNPSFNPETTSVVLVFSQMLEPTLTLREKLYQLLYRIRTL